MKLEIGNFYVKDIVFGEELSFKDGLLTINKEDALSFIRKDERITEAEETLPRRMPRLQGL